MSLIYLLAIVFGVLILVVLVTLIQLDDPRARMRLHSRLLRIERPPGVSLRQRLLPILDAIPVPGWFGGLTDTQTVIWSGIPLTEEQFHSAWWLTSWLGLLLGVLPAVLTSGNLAGTLLGFLFFLAGFAGPYYELQRRIRIRRRTVERDLPDFLDMLTFTIEAGLGLVPAIKRVSAGFEGALSGELTQALLQIDLGYSQREALQGLARRVPSNDVEHFVEAILLAERLGTSLARTMRIQSNLLRTRRRQRAEVQAQTAPIRIIPALVFFFLPSLLLIYLAPPIINFLLRR
jgi:Flp pilus assembly protein TadB